jgi:hypothetical protein
MGDDGVQNSATHLSREVTVGLVGGDVRRVSEAPGTES